MRKINTRDFHVATRTTSREINRRIALNLIREHPGLRGAAALIAAPTFAARRLRV